MKSAAPLALALAVLLALSLAGAPVQAADAPKAVGVWDIVATSPQGDMPSVLTLKLVDGQLKGEFDLGGAIRTVMDEKLEADVLTLKVEYEGGVYEVQAKLAGDTMEGTWQGSGYSGTLKAKRRP